MTIEVSQFISSFNAKEHAQRKRSRPYFRVYGRPAILEYLYQSPEEKQKFFNERMCSVRL